MSITPSSADETPSAGTTCACGYPIMPTATSMEMSPFTPASSLRAINARANTERMVFVAIVMVSLVALGVAPLVAVSAAAGGLGAAEAQRRWGK